MPSLDKALCNEAVRVWTNYLYRVPGQACRSTQRLIVTPTVPCLDRKLRVPSSDFMSPAAGRGWCIHTTQTGTLHVLQRPRAVSLSTGKLLACARGHCSTVWTGLKARKH